MTKPLIIAIGGFSSEVGKTTLMCDLLRRAFSGWEAIKLTRGHYRSCGKDPHACCVSHLLSDEPVVRSGFKETYSSDKDTGRYWDAGAGNVHWVIATDSQVEKGITQALARVTSPGILIEGNSFLQFIEPDYTLMVARAEGEKIKPSARRALRKTSALYLSDENLTPDEAKSRFLSAVQSSPERDTLLALPLYTHRQLSTLIELLHKNAASPPVVARQAPVE